MKKELRCDISGNNKLKLTFSQSWIQDISFHHGNLNCKWYVILSILWLWESKILARCKWFLHLALKRNSPQYWYIAAAKMRADIERAAIFPYLSNWKTHGFIAVLGLVRSYFVLTVNYARVWPYAAHYHLGGYNSFIDFLTLLLIYCRHLFIIGKCIN